MTTAATDVLVRHSADDIARGLGMAHLPTEEQRAVIEAPLRPLLVVAGAGSGKTETMAARVVWLVANGFVDPDQVLGLTFTRKAATELAERIGQRLRRLRQVGMWVPGDDEEAETLGGTPTVSTYHSYAGRLVREHALRLGHESESRLLSEAAAWQYASEAALSYDGPMESVAKAESTITAAVVEIAGEMAEHLLGTADIAAYLDELDGALAALPKGSSRAKDLPKETKAMRDALRERRAILPIVDRYLALKRRRDAIDFADQMALAAQLATSFEDIGAIERQRFRVVLLDEFQDTSEAQLELLRALFVAPGEPVPVTAVGDPHQSIYGWRGASATTLARFPRVFRDEAEALQLPLSTSWRNDRSVLNAANLVAAPLRAASTVPVRQLHPSPAAGRGGVAVARLSTAEEEAALVADWISGRRAAGARSSAILCRKRSQFPAVIDALEQRQVPFEVVGLGGLLLTPEVEDIVALLQVVHDPRRGDHLMRLLTGAPCRLGAADLDGLMAWARHQQEERQGSDGGAGAPREQAPEVVDEPSIVEALDALPRAGWRNHLGQGLSDVALHRLNAVQSVVRRLRSLSAMPLAEVVGEAERALGLDVEVLARPGYTPGAARAHLDAFADVAAGFTASADRPTLGGFLSWLTAAVAEERGLDKGYIEASPDAVHVLTIHAAKGLEWDAVAVPGLVESSFPAHSSNQSRHDGVAWCHTEPRDRGWASTLSGVPYDLRGDRDGLPVLQWRGAQDWPDIENRVLEFIGAGGGHAIAEERRLAYVAFTRARHDLLLTAAVWGSPRTPRVTSRFLTELLEDRELALLRGPWSAMPDPSNPETMDNPRSRTSASARWPSDPYAARRPGLEAAAAAVRRCLTAPGAAEGAAQAAHDPPSPAGIGAQPAGRPGQPSSPAHGHGHPPDELGEELELLLAERAHQREQHDTVVEVPRHLSTSAVIALAADAPAFASALRRPVPRAPALAARRGTAFHAWIEEHYARAAIVDVVDLPGSADQDPGDGTDLPQLKERFLVSDWAHRTPLEIETMVETVIDGIAVRGRIDAVFPRPGGGVTIVDWKTGRQPGPGESGVRVLQLAAYRVAYSRLRGIPFEQVDAAFYYATTGETVWPPLPGEAELVAVLRAVPEAGQCGPVQSR